MNTPRSRAPRSQRGIATILVVSLIGLGVAATAFWLSHGIRNAQEKHTAVHAITHAQTGVWGGVEAYRGYLAQLEPDEVKALSGQHAISFANGDYGELNVEITQVQDLGDSIRVYADVINRHDTARSSARVGVVYEVAGGSDDTVELSAALDFHDNLAVTGGIDFNADGTKRTRVNVDGTVTANSIDLDTVHELYATGTVDIDSAVYVDEIHSNGDVILKQGATTGTIWARGTVTTSGGSGATIIWANGNVSLGGSHPSTHVNSRSDVTVDVNGHGDFKLGGAMHVNANDVDNIASVGNVNLNNSSFSVTDIVSQGNIDCPNNSWVDFASVKTDGNTPSNCAAGFGSQSGVELGGDNHIDVMDEIAEFTIPRQVIDVWPLRSEAHYIFEREGNKTKVTVQNINGIADGEYYLGYFVKNYNTHGKNYLCAETDNNDQCSAASDPKPICQGWSLSNDCIAYNAGQWTFDGVSAAPGILWFNGDVAMNNGHNYNTLLATGDVSTAGSFRGMAVNYGGYSEVCDMRWEKIIDERVNAAETDAEKLTAQITSREVNQQSTYRSLFSGQYPTDLCDTTAREYNAKTLGNIGIAAGGYNPAGNGSFSGGDIDLGASNVIFGTVLAGDYLTTSGDTTVYGYITAAVQSGKGNADNSLGAKTTINLTGGPDSYNPVVVPDMSVGACSDCGGASPAGGDVARVLWSRYR